MILETTPQPSQEATPFSEDLFVIPQGLLGLAEKTKQYAKKAHYWLEKFRGRESKNSAWNSGYLIESVLTDERYQERDILYHRLREDFFSYLDEAVYWKTPWYPYDPYGIARSYLESMDVLGQNFVEDQRRKGASPSRAQIELLAMQFLNQWMEDPQVTPGSTLIWYSPRGEEPGYLGLEPDKPVKVNVYVRQEVGTQYRQYTTWALNDELRSLQEKVLKYNAKPHFLTDEESLPDDCAIINQLSLLDQPLDEPLWENLLYQNEQAWAKNRSDAPLDQCRTDYQGFIQFRQKVFDQYFRHVHTLIEETVAENQSFETLKKSSSYKKMLRFFDQQFSLSASSVLKMVENHEVPATILVKLYETQIALENHYRNVATSYDNDILRSANQFFQVSNKLFSLSQCGIMTPFSAPMSIMKESLSTAGLGLPSEVASLPLHTKQTILAELESQNYIELDLTHLGASQVWMVPTSYQEGVGCRVGKDGRVYGNCIVPPKYPEGIPLDDPIETVALPMNRQQFEQYKLELAQSIYQDQFADIEQQISNTPYLSQEEKQVVTGKFGYLKNTIIKKSIGLMEFIAGGLHFNLHSLLKLPTAISYVLVQCRSLAELMEKLETLTKNELSSDFA